MAATLSPVSGPPYRRRRPETTALYDVVRDNLESLYGAISDGALAVRIPKHAREELEDYLGCGLLCWRGFVKLRGPDCAETRLVAFSCKGRGFCPSCLGRRMNATAANLIERVLPEEASRRPLGRRSEAAEVAPSGHWERGFSAHHPLRVPTAGRRGRSTWAWHRGIECRRQAHGGHRGPRRETTPWSLRSRRPRPQTRSGR